MNRARSRIGSRSWSAWVFSAFLVAFFSVRLSPAARSSPDKERRTAAKAEVQKAQVNYKLGRFDDALEAYARAYELFNAPALLFNIGQCHKNLKNYDRAIFFFEGYLREETKPDPRKRTLAEELIVESRAEIEKQHAAEALAKRDSRATTSSVAAVFGPPPAVAMPAPILVNEPEKRETKRPFTHRWWFWTALGAGVLMAAGGAVGYYLSGPSTTALPTGTVGTLDRR